ncbi:hypothetical protein GCM10011321_00220 [Youhaiella tibetensis]|uniref:DUF1127 domain-containing protein n=1 Tax=Paradevosia tibetensis TaxID=1447062 RepID=A0A5B9DRP3_9HYPH|nr:DUF1127 domain-containing protein [Youhaiella tibetensis]QEE21742.1 DUF1127 domain-containing protein [Youhaiella tibetensis]GGF12050.1 hypothetical protein GCM10011321_00220 [Youhaiella tibetensis]
MNIRETLAKYAQYRVTIRELNSLSNRQLSDLGISRADIKTVARTASF